MKKTQSQTNPYVNSDTNKRYYTYEYYLRRRFGAKCAKIPLDAGFSCPNIDAGGGCIYCSGRGSGDCIPCGLSLREQYEAGRVSLSSKWDTSRCIAYLQAHTNTYAPVDVLRRTYDEILSFDGVLGLNIATRADCLSEEVCLLLAEVSERTVLTVELGLQTSSDTVAEAIGRGHSFSQFCEGYRRLRAIAPRAEICAHIIFGLPGESRADMMRTVRDLAALCPDQVKIHLLHVICGTPMYDIYIGGGYLPLEKDEYVSTVAEALTYLPPDTVICRLTGDGLAEDLAAPLWSRKKTAVINDIDKKMYENDLWQGKFFKIVQ